MTVFVCVGGCVRLVCWVDVRVGGWFVFVTMWVVVGVPGYVIGVVAITVLVVML